MFATLQAKLYLAAGILILGGVGGWFVSGKFHDASDARELRAMIREQNKEVKRLKEFNDATATREKEILAQIAALNEALGKINREIESTDVGTCRITPDGDRLRQQGYRQAFTP